MSALPNPNTAYYRQLQNAGIPILFFHSYYPQLPIPHVGMNDEQAGKMAAQYLISQGHTRIGGIFKADDGQGRGRYSGYVQALHEAGIGVKEELVTWIDSQELRDAFSMSPRILNRLSTCTACVCYNDEVAHVLTKICLEKGIRIPEDLSLVSIDNSELARLNYVPLTSVAHPMERLGEKAAEHILKLAENPSFDATYEFETQIEIRSSVCAREKKADLS